MCYRYDVPTSSFIKAGDLSQNNLTVNKRISKTKQKWHSWRPKRHQYNSKSLIISMFLSCFFFNLLSRNFYILVVLYLNFYSASILISRSIYKSFNPLFLSKQHKTTTLFIVILDEQIGTTFQSLLQSTSTKMSSILYQYTTWLLFKSYQTISQDY